LISRNRLIPRAFLVECFKNNKELALLNDPAERGTRMGIDKVLDYMLRNEMLAEAKDKRGKRKVYRATEVLKLSLEGVAK